MWAEPTLAPRVAVSAPVCPAERGEDPGFHVFHNDLSFASFEKQQSCRCVKSSWEEAVVVSSGFVSGPQRDLCYQTLPELQLFLSSKGCFSWFLFPSLSVPACGVIASSQPRRGRRFIVHPSWRLFLLINKAEENSICHVDQ